MIPHHRPPVGLLRAFRDRYVASFGGLSYDVAPGAVGVDPAILESAPELDGRRVLVRTGHERPVILDHQPTFIVTPLTHLMRNANEVAQNGGGVVFSTFDLETPRAAGLLQRLGVGETLFLNASIGILDGAAVKRPDFGGAPAT